MSGKVYADYCDNSCILREHRVSFVAVSLHPNHFHYCIRLHPARWNNISLLNQQSFQDDFVRGFVFLSSRLLEVITVERGGRWCLIVDAEIVGSWLLLLLLQLRHRLAPTASVSDEWIVFRPSFWCRRRRRTATCTGEVDAPGHATVQPEPSVSLYTRDVVVPSSGPSILTSLYSAKGSARSWHVRRVSEGQLPLIRKRTKNYGWITEYYNISKVHVHKTYTIQRISKTISQIGEYM